MKVLIEYYNLNFPSLFLEFVGLPLPFLKNPFVLCSINGPSYKAINFNGYVKEYLKNPRNLKCDAIHSRGGERKSLDQFDGEKETTRASSYSALYVQVD